MGASLWCIDLWNLTRRSCEGRNLDPQRFRFLLPQERRGQGLLTVPSPSGGGLEWGRLPGVASPRCIDLWNPTRRSCEGRNLDPQRFRFLLPQERRGQGLLTVPSPSGGGLEWGRLPGVASPRCIDLWNPTRRSCEGRNLDPQRFRFLLPQERRGQGLSVVRGKPLIVARPGDKLTRNPLMVSRSNHKLRMSGLKPE